MAPRSKPDKSNVASDEMSPRTALLRRTIEPVGSPTGPVSVVDKAAAEVADENAELAAGSFACVLINTLSMTCTTPLETSTSGCKIRAVVPNELTKVPEELVVNVKGSPAAVIRFADVKLGLYTVVPLMMLFLITVNMAV